jgi:mono/diheme cytochrome c family protein
MQLLMKKVFYISSLLVAVTVLATGCVSRGNNTGWEYAPDMAYSKGYEPYNQGDSNVINPYGMSMREPVAGTVAIGKNNHYPFDNSGDGYELAKTYEMPAGIEDKENRGQYLFNIYCTPCHGYNGGNDGEIFKRGLGKPAWANFQDKYIKEIPVGQIYHTLTYGKGNMGSHAYALTPDDRWRVIKYVKQLSGAGVETKTTKDSATVKTAKR